MASDGKKLDPRTAAPVSRAGSPELEELDLLGSESVGRNDDVFDNVDLTSTLDAFNSRIQRKKKEQELANNSADTQARERQRYLLSAMMKIRKSLSEVVKLDLGERFRLELEADDWQGWPRLTIRLLDVRRPNAEHQQFQVLSHDRNARSTVEILYSSEKELETLFLTREQDLQRVPLTLKKCVREYLDQVAEIVLSTHKKVDRDLDEDEEMKRQEILIEEKPEPDSMQGVKDDFFVDDVQDKKSFLEKLPELNEEDFQPLALSISGRTS